MFQYHPAVRENPEKEVIREMDAVIAKGNWRKAT
jgi:hypothetical protein